MEYQLKFEELDFGIPGGFWLDSVMNCEVYIGADSIEEWWVHSVKIDVCGSHQAKYSTMQEPGYQKNEEMCRMVEEAIKRRPYCHGRLEDEIRSDMILRASLRCDFA